MAAEVAPSFNAQVRALKKGESLAKVERISLGDPDTGAMVAEALFRLKRTVNSSVSKMREETGSNFRVETGSLITHDNEAVVAVVTVSRL
jgi:hypothetical protein